MSQIKLSIWIMRLIIVASFLNHNSAQCQVLENNSFAVAGHVVIHKDANDNTYVQVDIQDEEERPNTVVVVEAESESVEDIEEAKKEAGLQLINLLLKGGSKGSQVMPGPDGKGDYRGGGESIPKTGPGTIFDIDFGLNIMGRKRPPLRRQYKGSNNLKKNFIRDFMKALRA